MQEERLRIGWGWGWWVVGSRGAGQVAEEVAGAVVVEDFIFRGCGGMSEGVVRGGEGRLGRI